MRTLHFEFLQSKRRQNASKQVKGLFHLETDGVSPYCALDSY